MTVSYEHCLVGPAATLLDGLRAIDRGGIEIALIVGDGGRLTGIMTDGDARRAILAAAGLDSPLSPHARRDFIFVGPDTTRAEVLDLMQARRIKHLPILDDDRRLLGLHLLHDMLGGIERTNWAVVMAGGEGRRLRPLTEHTPKPMLRVAGRPILERIVLHLVGYGIRRVFLSVNYLGNVIEDHFGDGERFGCRIQYVREDEPMGTGGALGLLPETPVEPFIVMNGDLMTQINIDQMLRFHIDHHALATIGTREYVHNVPFGCIDRDGSRVLGLREKPQLRQSVNAGIYVLAPEALTPMRPGSRFDLPDLITTAIGSGKKVVAFDIDDDWMDIGRREQLDRARGESAD
jgi:dTDP-glucose pyrophosphorylase